LKVTGGDDLPESGLREARVKAMDLLARREHGCRELERKLRQRGFDESQVRQVVEQLRIDNLVSDQRFAEAVVRSKAERLQGPVKIRAALRQAGVEEPLIESALENEAGRWQEAADAFVGSRGRPGMELKERARIYRAGIGRGFTHEQVMAALDRLNSDD